MPRRYSPRRRYPASGYGSAYTTVKNRQDEATEKQLAYLKSLMGSHDIGMDPEDADLMYSLWADSGALTKGFVSDRINEYKACPKRERKQAGPGYYEYEGDLYVVVENKAKTRTYAKKLVGEPIYMSSDEPGWEFDSTPKRTDWRWDFEAAKGIASRLADATPLTEEAAAKWGHLHGRCFKCLKPLTDPESVKRGYGPVCAKVIKR